MTLEVSKTVLEQPPPPQSEQSTPPEELEPLDELILSEPNDKSDKCCLNSWGWKMKCCATFSVLLVLLFSIAAACLFRNPTLFMYPLHASCNITWTFKEDCNSVANKIAGQMETWKTNETCGTGQKCLYTVQSVTGNVIKGIHTTPKAGYIDDLEFTFYPNTATHGCNVLGFSTSRIFFAVLDFGTNYCNLHNLVDGAGLRADSQYSELTRDEICTQYTSANCEKY